MAKKIKLQDKNGVQLLPTTRAEIVEFDNNVTVKQKILNMLNRHTLSFITSDEVSVKIYTKKDISDYSEETALREYTFQSGEIADIVVLDDEHFEVINTTSGISKVLSWPGIITTWQDWFEDVLSWQNCVFRFGTEYLPMSKWQSTNASAKLGVTEAQYKNCIFWDDLPMTDNMWTGPLYILHKTTECPLFYSIIRENTYSVVAEGYNISIDDNWNNADFLYSFSQNTGSIVGAMAFAYRCQWAVPSATFMDPNVSTNIFTLPPTADGIFYFSGAEVIGTIDAKNVSNWNYDVNNDSSGDIWRAPFAGCFNLRELRLKNLKANINLSWSPLSLKSLEYLVSNANNTNAINIKLSTYSYYTLTDEIKSAATAKNITFVLDDTHSKQWDIYKDVESLKTNNNEPLIVNFIYNLQNNSTTSDVLFADAWEAYNTDKRTIFVNYKVNNGSNDIFVCSGAIQSEQLYNMTVSAVFGDTPEQRLTGVLYTGYNYHSNIRCMQVSWTANNIDAQELWMYSGEGSLSIDAPWDFASETTTFNYNGTIDFSQQSDRTQENTIIIRSDLNSYVSKSELNSASYISSSSLNTTLSSYVTSANYDSNAKKIYLKHNSTTLSEIDATDFIKDGMVDTAYVQGANLVISFNTDAGKEAVNVPIANIFNANNYYTKTEINNAAYLQSETDPVYSASAAAGITSSDITNWNSKTNNVGTITGITMNNTSKGTSGVVDLGTVLTSETDPIYSASVAAGITASDITNWNNKTSNTGTITGITMNGASKGTSGVVNLGTVVTSETDPIYSASVAAGITASDITNWNNKLSSFTETDPIFTASVAHGITSTDITNWNTKLTKAQADGYYVSYAYVGSLADLTTAELNTIFS